MQKKSYRFLLFLFLSTCGKVQFIQKKILHSYDFSINKLNFNERQKSKFENKRET